MNKQQIGPYQADLVKFQSVQTGRTSRASAIVVLPKWAAIRSEPPNSSDVTGVFGANIFAPRISAAQRCAAHVESPSEIDLGGHGITGHTAAMIDKMTAPHVPRRGGGYDRADRHEGIGVGEEIHESSVRAALLRQHMAPFWLRALLAKRGESQSVPTSEITNGVTLLQIALGMWKPRSDFKGVRKRKKNRGG